MTTLCGGMTVGRLPLGAITISVLLAAAIFAFDLLLPLGVAGGVPYVALVLVGLWFPAPWVVLVLAGVGSVLTVAGYFLSEPAGVPWMVLVNRALALFAIWIVAILGFQRRLGEIALSQSHEQLEDRVMRRTEALRESEAKLNAFFENAPVGLATFDDQLRYTKINEALARLNGIPAEEHIGRTIADVMPALAPIVSSQYREILETGKPQLNTEFTAKFPGMEGDEQHRMLSRFPIPGHDGKPVGIGAVALDITERKLAEKAAKESEERFRAVVDNSPDAVLFKDLDGRFRIVNERACDWHGQTEKELVGSTSGDLFPSGEAEIATKLDQEVLRDLKVAKREHDLTYSDGTVRRVMTTKFPVSGRDGQVLGIGIISTDISDRRQVEEQLRQAQKMEAIGQLTGGVAHDFNNLLTVVLGNLELLRDDTSEHENHHRLVGSAIRATERGAMLTKSLLAFSRKQTLQPKELNLNELVNNMLDMLHRTLGENIEIEAKTADSLWTALADPAQVGSALLNLALNSRDAMPTGGELTIEAENIKIDEYAAAQINLTPGDYVLLSVLDTGVGMPEEVLVHVFEPFYTTKDVGEGSGLGLSMIYGFAKQSGGHVSIYSKVGHGTTVKLYLPRAKQADLEAEPDVASDVSGAHEETILVVEDDPDVRTLAVALLDDLGYEVLEAGDGPSAIAAMKSRSRIDLLLADVVLAGGMSGPEVAAEAKRIHPAMRILFMSGYSNEVMIRSRQLGESADMLNKPFRKADLARKIRGALCKAAPVAADSSA